MQPNVPLRNECIKYFPGGGEDFKDSARAFLIPQKSGDIKWNKGTLNSAFFKGKLFEKANLIALITPLYSIKLVNIKLIPEIIK